MALDDKTLQSFFQKQKKASIDSLLSNQPQPKRGVSKALAIREQSVSNTLAIREQSVSKASPEALAVALAIREQYVSKALASDDINTLVGNEKKLLLYIFAACQQAGSMSTLPITSEDLVKHLEISPVRLRNLIYRLTKKRFINVLKVKNGQAGWRIFGLNSEVHQRLFLKGTVNNTLAMREQCVSNASLEASPEALASSLSSSSYNNLNTTTSDLNSEWQELNIDPLRQYGFNDAHKKQLATGKSFELGFEMVQDSIYLYAFQLQHKNKVSYFKKTPVELFMGILRREGLPYPRPANYKSRQELEIEKYRQQKLEELEKIKKLKEDSEKIDFEIWLEALHEDEKNKLIESLNLPKGLRNEGSIRGNLIKYYNKNIK